MQESYNSVICTKISSTVDEGIENLQIQKSQRKSLRDNEVRIKAYACSLNFFDLLMLVGKYQLKPKLPFVMGSEGSGVIIEVGSKVSHLKVGDEVIFGMQIGALAEELVVPSFICIPKPKGFTHVQSAGLFVGFTTAYNGLVQRGNLKEGEFLLVTGAAGGMGSIAIQLGKLLGAKVIAAASTEEKLDVAKKLGADFVVNYVTQDMKNEIAKITNGKYVDVIYDTVGGDIFQKCVRCIGDEGRLLVIGFASGNIPSIQANLPLVKGFSVVGVRAGESMRRHPEYAIEMFNKLNEWGQDGKLQPPYVEHVFTLRNFKNAFKLISDRKVIGKAVISITNSPKL